MAELDFSDLREPGRYRLRLRDVGSGSFAVDDGVFRPLPDVLLEFMRQQRYAETTWADDMEWGAAELFRATGRESYLDDARRYAAMTTSRTTRATSRPWTARRPPS